MAQHQYRSFGQGAAGFGKYYGGAFADQAIGNMMTQALLPIALHQDPRYFTKGRGGFLKRTGYAISREVITRNDDGRNHFNTSLVGNAIAAGMLYFGFDFGKPIHSNPLPAISAASRRLRRGMAFQAYF